MKHFFRMVLLMVVAVSLCSSALAQNYEKTATPGTLIEQLLLQRAADGKTLIPVDDKAVFYPAVYADGAKLFPGTLTTKTSDFTFNWFSPNETTVPLVDNPFQLWGSEQLRGAMDKLVFVKNVSDQDIAFRTIVAFPKPISQKGSNAADATGWGSKVLELYNTNDYSAQWVCNVSIADHNPDKVLYDLLVLSCNSALPKKCVASPSLLQIALSKTVTNEDLRAFNLVQYELLIKTEAFSLSTAGDGKLFPLGVYEITQTQHPWSK